MTGDRNDTVEDVLAHVFSAWRTNRAEVLRHRQDGFDWLPGQHVVHVQCNERGDERGRTRFRLAIMTEYLRSVPANDPVFVRQAALMADFLWPTCAPVYGPVATDGTLPDLHLCSSIYFDAQEAEPLTALLAGLAVLQPIYAELQSTKAPSMLEGGVPAHTRREGPINDPAMALAREIILPEGEKSSAWAGSREFRDFAAERRNSEYSIIADHSGMTIQVDAGFSPARIVFKTDQPHPHHGSGLLVSIELLASPNLDEICKQAARLNFLEASNWTEIPQLGCWHATEGAEGRHELGHCSFIPNSSFVPQLVAVLADWALQRTSWVRNVGKLGPG
jgi:hypothetical protein